MTGDKTCPNCLTLHTNLEVEGDEDGGVWVYLETEPCAAPGCEARLCSCCAAFSCDGCDQRYCLEHRTLYADLSLCPECLPDPLEELVPCPPPTPRKYQRMQGQLNFSGVA